MGSPTYILPLLPLLWVCTLSSYPVPLPPGGRLAVHGWLILPVDQPFPSDPTTPVTAYFSHHTPEFWSDSPHDFQIILTGTITPMSTAGNSTFPIDIPYPPSSNLLVNEFTITPPAPFSLNDLLAGDIKQLIGVVYNGSFDTSYERYAIAIATLDRIELTTAVYLNISDTAGYPYLRYLSYPRTLAPSKTYHLYLAHQIHSPPDFDQIVHVVVGSCECKGDKNICNNVDALIQQPAAVWEVKGVDNKMENRLSFQFFATPPLYLTYLNAPSNVSITCAAKVLEELHCVYGPAFGEICESIKV